MIIAVDFDGTCVKHKHPLIGSDIGAQKTLMKLVNSGHHLILYTMRSGDELQEAINWFRKNKITLFSVNTNPSQKTWTTSPKCYAQLYIDDAALGIPLKRDSNDERPYVDWNAVEELLYEENLIIG